MSIGIRKSKAITMRWVHYFGHKLNLTHYFGHKLNLTTTYIYKADPKPSSRGILKPVKKNEE